MPYRVRSFRSEHRTAVISSPITKSAAYHICVSDDVAPGLAFRCVIGDFFGPLPDAINHAVTHQPDLRW